MLPLSPSLLTTLAAALLYAAATVYQSTRLATGAKANKRLLVSLGVFAVLAHGASLLTHLLTPIGLGLDFFSASSLIAAAVILTYIVKSVFWHDGDSAKEERAAARGRIDASVAGRPVDERR